MIVRPALGSDWAAGIPRDHAPVCLLLHGWGGNGELVMPWAEAVAERAVCIVPDLPGHGQSAERAFPGVDALRTALLDALAGLTGRPLVLAGWSLGAALALDVAARLDPAPYALVMVGGFARMASGDGYPCGVSPALLKAMLGAYRTLPGRVLAEFADRCFSPSERQSPDFAGVRDRLLTALRAGDTKAMGAALKALAEFDARPAADGLATRVLLVHGTDDAIVPIAASRWLADRLAEAELRELAGAGHALPLTQPGACARALRDVLP